MFYFGSLSNEGFFIESFFGLSIYLILIFFFFLESRNCCLENKIIIKKPKKKNQRAPSPKGIEFPCAGVCRASVNFFISNHQV